MTSIKRQRHYIDLLNEKAAISAPLASLRCASTRPLLPNLACTRRLSCTARLRVEARRHANRLSADSLPHLVGWRQTGQQQPQGVPIGLCMLQRWFGEVKYHYFNWRKNTWSDLQLFVLLNVLVFLLGGSFV